MIAEDAERVNTRLPKGYRARPFRDSDREPLVEERNSWSHRMEQQSAEEWRMWERMAPDETQYRISRTTPVGWLDRRMSAPAR